MRGGRFKKKHNSCQNKKTRQGEEKGKKNRNAIFFPEDASVYDFFIFYYSFHCISPSFSPSPFSLTHLGGPCKVFLCCCFFFRNERKGPKKKKKLQKKQYWMFGCVCGRSRHGQCGRGKSWKRLLHGKYAALAAPQERSVTSSRRRRHDLAQRARAANLRRGHRTHLSVRGQETHTHTCSRANPFTCHG